MRTLFDDRSGRRLASLTVLSGLLFLSSTSFAQEAEDGFSNGLGSPPSEPEAATDPSAPSADGAEEAAPPPSEPEAAEPEASTEASAKAEAQVALPATPPSDAKKADETPKPPPLALENLPASAYPNDPINGIRGGSLRFVMSGMQWPYMPSYGDDQPKLRIGISGSSWVDFNYKMIRPGLATSPDVAEGRVQGRLTLRISPVYNFKNGWFGQSRIEFVGITEQQHEANKYVDLDEAWVRLGKWNKFDLTVGRTQGFEIYHFGMGLDINTQEREGAQIAGVSVQQAYSVSEIWDRGINNGAAALHFYMPNWLRLELLGRMGTTGTGNDIGVRPAGIVDLGWLKLKGGYEFRLETPTLQGGGDLTKREVKGYGGQVNFVYDPWIEAGFGAAHRIVDRIDQNGAVDVNGTSNTTTFGGFLNVRPYFENWMVGLGYHNTYFENFNFDTFGYAENQTHQQMFGAVQYQLWDRFFFKYVFAYSTVSLATRNDQTPVPDNAYENKQVSHRLRFMMLF